MSNLLTKPSKEKKEKSGLYDSDSVQVVYTPPEFLIPARRVYTVSGNFSYDFAASEPNVCDVFFTEADNSLGFSWADLFGPGITDDPGWCNCPFRHSDKFLAHAAQEAPLGSDVVMLVQCAAGCSYWHRNQLVWGNPFAELIILEGRIAFIEPSSDSYKNEKTGKNNGAKTDCVNIRYNRNNVNLSAEERVKIWNWRDPYAIPTPAWRYH